MNGIMSRLILIQPTIERVALSCQKPQKWFRAQQFLQHSENFWQEMKKILTVGAVTRNIKTSLKPVLDPNSFSLSNKLLLILANIFNLTYRAK